jgi:hypothetical protein
MVPLAVGGPVVIPVAIVGALVLIAILLRAESREERRNRSDATNRPRRRPEAPRRGS